MGSPFDELESEHEKNRNPPPKKSGFLFGEA